VLDIPDVWNALVVGPLEAVVDGLTTSITMKGPFQGAESLCIPLVA
jgi:hypothetical protein